MAVFRVPKVSELENADIVGLVRAKGLSMEEFAELLGQLQPNEEAASHED